ncbi:MAG: ribbon-helix-helix protein, CopG family [Proteobacteria bacterium]|jgi:metal-responsive CopG/Arc/MetJ family transcriptional regulator|nr:ribbon-helix-helix protein, CopG family [Pseudomonadota bacterium]
MRTVQMTLENELVEAVDRLVKALGSTRSAFARDALRAALQRHRERELEERHRKGYERFPVDSNEFANWEDEQAWGD